MLLLPISYYCTNQCCHCCSFHFICCRAESVLLLFLLFPPSHTGVTRSVQADLPAVACTVPLVAQALITQAGRRITVRTLVPAPPPFAPAAVHSRAQLLLAAHEAVAVGGANP